MELVITAHIALGELGILAFFWVLMELINGPSVSGVLRAKGAALSGVVSFFAAWVVAGIYYVVQYGSVIKPVIQQGAWSWSHGIFMEAKEHIFLFLPFLAIASLVMILQYEDQIRDNPRVKSGLYVLVGTTALLGALMTVMGYFVSSGYRQGLLQ